MRLARALSDVEAKKVQTLVLLGGVFTTLTIWTKLEDPINLPKMFVLVLFGSVILGLILPAILNFRNITNKDKRYSFALIGFLFICLTIVTITTNVSYTAFYGEFHRNNGYLSYLAMIVLLIASAFAFDLKSTDKFIKYFSVLSILISGYGLFQLVGKDPIDWVAEYSPVITTLGNPNFTSGFLGLSGISTFYLFLSQKNLNAKSIYGFIFAFNLFILAKTGSIQGFFGMAVGISLVVIVKLWNFNKRIGQISLLAVAVFSTPIVLAVFNFGPLASKLYQGTLRNRLDYWHAALGMFRDHPIFGVGIDRFGEYYRQYAAQNQVVQGQITDNAHSIYMQLLATGGLMLIVPYLLLVSLITYRGFKLLINSKGDTKLQVSTVFGIWLGTIIINLVTVDNLGVGVWFWISGGVLLSMTFQEDDKSVNVKTELRPVKRKKSNKNYIENSFPISQVIAGSLALVTLIILLPILNNSTNLKSVKETQPGPAGSEYMNIVKSLAQSNWSNPQNLIQLSALAFKSSDLVTGDSILDRIFELDGRSYYANYFRAFTLEAVGKNSDAIPYREKLSQLDPWNNLSLIELIKDYKSVGKIESATAIAALIKENYPGSQADIDASALLVG